MFHRFVDIVRVIGTFKFDAGSRNLLGGFTRGAACFRKGGGGGGGGGGPTPPHGYAGSGAEGARGISEGARGISEGARGIYKRPGNN